MQAITLNLPESTTMLFVPELAVLFVIGLLIAVLAISVCLILVMKSYKDSLELMDERHMDDIEVIQRSIDSIAKVFSSQSYEYKLSIKHNNDVKDMIKSLSSSITKLDGKIKDVRIKSRRPKGKGANNE